MATQAFEELQWVGGLMGDFPRPWFVAGGWAIDLFLNRPTRPHEDIDVALLRRDQEVLQGYLRGWNLRKAIPGVRRVMEAWGEGERLEPPVHEIHANDPRGERPELEFLLNESTGGVWRFRRKLEVARPISQMGGVSSTGIPYLAPEIVLLYKAKDPTEADETDFRNARPALADEPGEWLRISLEACHPEHPWLAEFQEW